LPDVTLGYTPADNTVFDPLGFSDDLYKQTAGVSLYETANGHVEFANLAAGTKVRQHHVRPWQAGDAKSEGASKPVDFFQNAYGKDTVFYGVAGATLTWNQKYDCSMALFFTSFFANIWRQRGVESAGPSWAAAPDIFVKMFLDGKGIACTQRHLPETIYYSSTNTFGGAGGGKEFTFSREQANTRYMNLHHTKYAGGSSGDQTGPLLAGWHTVGLGLFLAVNQGVETLALGKAAVTPLFPPMTCDAMHRVRLSVRHADVVRLL